MDERVVKVAVYMPEGMYRDMKIYCATNQLTVTRLASELVRLHLESSEPEQAFVVEACRARAHGKEPVSVERYTSIREGLRQAAAGDTVDMTGRIYQLAQRADRIGLNPFAEDG